MALQLQVPVITSDPADLTKIADGLGQKLLVATI
jgi:hypothetical protein